MSLIDNMMKPCVIMNKLKQPDGEGGFNVEWQEGAVIDVAIVHYNDIQTRIGEREGLTSSYTLTTRSDVKLEFHDVIKRLEDDAVFRVTSNAGDNTSPASSTLNIAQVSAERWQLT